MNDSSGKYPHCIEPLWDRYHNNAWDAVGAGGEELYLWGLASGGWHSIDDDLPMVREFVAQGWLVSEKRSTRTYKYKLSDAAWAEIETLKAHLKSTVQQAACLSDMTLEQFCANYYPSVRRRPHPWQVRETFRRLLYASSNIASDYKGNVHWHLADDYQPERPGEAKLIQGQLAHVHCFFGRPFLSASAKLLIIRMKAWGVAKETLAEMDRALAERLRRLDAVREERLARTQTKELAKPSFWFDLVPEDVARRQERWDKCMAALRMNRLGFSYRNIAEEYEISHNAVSTMVHEAERDKAKGKLTPVEIYLSIPIATLIDERLAEAVFTFYDWASSSELTSLRPRSDSRS
ncbi:hypothetical protein [Mesorhizobium sp. A556]